MKYTNFKTAKPRHGQTVKMIAVVPEVGRVTLKGRFGDWSGTNFTKYKMHCNRNVGIYRHIESGESNPRFELVANFVKWTAI